MSRVTTLGLFSTLYELDFRITLGESRQLAGVGPTGLDRQKTHDIRTDYVHDAAGVDNPDRTPALAEHHRQV
jgi:hypothetical protein